MPRSFVGELTIFHEEQAIAQRYFFGYLTIRNKAAEDSELLGVINLNPWFWITVDHSLLLATFIALGRIFDQDTPHNIDQLMSAVSADLNEFSLAATIKGALCGGACDIREACARTHCQRGEGVEEENRVLAACLPAELQRYKA